MLLFWSMRWLHESHEFIFGLAKGGHLIRPGGAYPCPGFNPYRRHTFGDRDNCMNMVWHDLKNIWFQI